VDVDRVKPVAQRYRVNAMPTFKVLKRGQEVGELVGADPDKLRALVATHAGH